MHKEFETDEIIFNQKISFFEKDEQAVNNLKRIKASFQRYGNFILSSYKSEIIDEILEKVAYFSNYLTDILVRNPDYLSYFLNESKNSEKYSYENYQKFCNTVLEIFKSSEKKISGLIRLKRREMFRTGLRDILYLADTIELMTEYSSLTRALIESSFIIALDETKSKYKIKNLTNRFCMISLGKLGGNELNYSSDVDLMFIFDEDKKLGNSINSSEFFERVLYNFLELANTNRNDGFLFRIDFRLRPEGKNSPLCRNISNTLFYYESKGSPWERQMLLRANFLFGDFNLFEQFFNGIKKFVYPASTFEHPKVIIKRYKQIYKEQIENEFNIKFTKGGIRDIEFSVQVLQLIFGGLHKELRTQNTSDALRILSEKSFISATDSESLINYYNYFRKIENFIQLFNDQQTHLIPENDIFLGKLATYLKLSQATFIKHYKNSLKNVSKILGRILDEHKPQKKNRPVIKFSNLSKAANNFNIIENGFYSCFTSFGNSERMEQLQKIIFQIKKYLQNSSNPDKCLDNLVKIFINSEFGFFWFRQLENQKFIDALLRISDYSDLLVNQLSFNKRTNDFFIAGNIFVLQETPVIFNNYDNNELDLLNFYLLFNLLDKKFDCRKIGSELKTFYESVIKNKTELLNKKRKINDNDIMIISLGSFAGNELTFASDLDLIFLFNDKKNKKFDFFQNYFCELLSSLKNSFPDLNIDTRLRPEGKSSQIAWEYNEFLKYINLRSRIWEFQAYTKMNLIYGETPLFEKLREVIKNSLDKFNYDFIFKEINTNKINLKKTSILSNSTSINLKLDDGGIVDYQFLKQLLNLFGQKSKIANPGFSDDTIFNINLNSLNKIFKKDLAILEKNYFKLKNLGLIIYLFFNRKKPLILNNDSDDIRFKNFLKLKKDQNLMNYITGILAINKQIINRIITYLEKEIYENN